MSKFKKRLLMPGGPREIDGAGFTVLRGMLAIFQIAEVRSKFFITLFILFVFRLGSHIPVPGFDVQGAAAALSQSGGSGRGFMDFLDLFSGGGLKRFTIMALGIMPFITAEIIMQLLMGIVPQWQKIAKEDPDAGKEFMQFWSRILTIGIAGVQAFVTSNYIVGQIQDHLLVPRLQFQLLSVVAITAGTMFLIWLSDKIDKHGVGNGTSMIIFAGIIARMPQAINSLWKKLQAGDVDFLSFVIVIVLFVIIIIMIIFVNRAKRKIPIGGSKVIKGGKIAMIPSFSLNIPFNPAGVIPIIFASVFLSFPTQLISMLKLQGAFWVFVGQGLSPGQMFYTLLNAGLIILFTYFYSQFTLNPDDIASNLQKSGRTIKGKRAGSNAADDIKKTIKRIILPGAIFLALIASIPDIINKLMNLPIELIYIMGGTSIIIIAGVAFDITTIFESVRRFRHRS